jgi:hypothetical protein
MSARSHLLHQLRDRRWWRNHRLRRALQFWQQRAEHFPNCLGIGTRGDANEDTCRRHGIRDRREMFQLSQFLHDLGIFLHFQTDALLRHYLILKPNWGTAAVYKTEIQKPADQRSLPRLKRSLIALLGIAGLIATPVAGMTDFTNNVLEIGNKLHIELPKLP